MFSFPCARLVPTKRALTGLVSLAIALPASAVFTAQSASAATPHIPYGHLGTDAVVVGSVHLIGWAIDPDTRAPIHVSVTVDGAPATTALAAIPRGKVKKANPGFGAKHGFDLSVPLGDGTHQVCVTALNVGRGSDKQLGCASLEGTNEPVGGITTSEWQSGAISVSGWALDPNTLSPVKVALKVDGQPVTDVTANQPASGLPSGWTSYGTQHGFAARMTAAPGPHRVCASVTNVGLGSNAGIGCIKLTNSATAPSAPQSVSVAVTSTTATVSWAAPAHDGGAALTGYTATLSSGTSHTATAATPKAVFTGLTPNQAYTVTVTAANAIGASTGTTANFTTAAAPASPIPPQTTPAPVSTSHYLRNLTGVVSHDTALMYAMGANDAGYNPSGHRYLVLQDIGAQTGGGVLLSALIKYIGYPDLVASLKAYVDGYATTQKANAPMMMAIGTNNDGSVSYTQGQIWADQVVDPVRSYAAKYANIRISGANDMEPGFYAGPSTTEAWLKGYLSATKALFYFNGSADGCPTSTSYSQCNNGWTTGVLHYLSGGAAPTQIRVLPQIYNTTMPLQWRTISLAGSQRIRFAGPLTEWTACAQGGGCGSLTNVYAWQVLFNDLNALRATAIDAMPYGTDLRIN